MVRTIAVILLILVGIVGVASGIWGLSLQQNSEVDPALLDAAQTVLGYADTAMEAVDSKVSEWTGGKLDVTGLLNNLVGDEVDLTDDGSMRRFAFLYATELLLSGIICIETGLLLKRSKR